MFCKMLVSYWLYSLCAIRMSIVIAKFEGRLINLVRSFDDSRSLGWRSKGVRSDAHYLQLQGCAQRNLGPLITRGWGKSIEFLRVSVVKEDADEIRQRYTGVSIYLYKKVLSSSKKHHLHACFTQIYFHALVKTLNLQNER